MYKKLFGIALLAHILVFAFIGLRQGTEPATANGSENLDTPAHPFSRSKAESEVEEDDLLEEIEPKLELAVVEEFPDTASEVLPGNIRTDDLTSGFLYDFSNQRLLWEKDSTKPVRIASMTKMMTALLAFEDEESKSDLSMDTVIQVTTDAFKIGGSQVWLDPRESFTLEELLISIMVKSANDSSYLVGEYLAEGSMDGFVERMNERAVELKMNSTHFFNAHGLPEGKMGNTASCQDLARLAIALMRYEKALEWASIQTYKFRADNSTPTVIANHNRLILTTEGVDGLKTGYTKRAGFCVTATCLRDGRRLIAVTTGFKSSKRRDTFTQELINWGYSQLAKNNA